MHFSSPVVLFRGLVERGTLLLLIGESCCCWAGRLVTFLETGWTATAVGAAVVNDTIVSFFLRDGLESLLLSTVTLSVSRRWKTPLYNLSLLDCFVDCCFLKSSSKGFNLRDSSEQRRLSIVCKGKVISFAVHDSIPDRDYRGCLLSGWGIDSFKVNDSRYSCKINNGNRDEFGLSFMSCQTSAKLSSIIYSLRLMVGMFYEKFYGILLRRSESRVGNRVPPTDTSCRESRRILSKKQATALTIFHSWDDHDGR